MPRPYRVACWDDSRPSQEATCYVLANCDRDAEDLAKLTYPEWESYEAEEVTDVHELSLIGTALSIETNQGLL